MYLTGTLAGLTVFLGATAAFPAAGSHAGNPKFDWDKTKYLLAFGDSYTFIQGTHGYPNYSFIGDNINFAYDAEKLLTNLIVQNQTSTAEGGPNWVEFITGCGLKPGYTSPLSCKKQLWDFAFAGADITEELTPLHHNFTIMLDKQVLQYQTYGHPVLRKIIDPSRTLVAVWIGINDINDSARYAVDFPTFYNQLHDALFKSVQTLYSLGYKSYLFLNLPPLNRTPGNQASASPLPNATMISWFNDALSAHASAFASNHSDTSVLVYDVNTLLNHVLDKPADYDIVNTTSFCRGYNQPDIDTNYQAYGCPTPLSKYFWYNSGHTTSRVHEILAGALLKTLKAWRG